MYKNSIAQVKPWLEKAEVKMAIGLTKPSTLEEAKHEYEQIKTFNKESEDIKLKIATIAEMSSKMSAKTTARAEVDALKSRQEASQAVAHQWLNKMESLVQSWNQFNALSEQMQSWASQKEELMSKPVDLSSPDLNNLTGELQNNLMQKKKSYVEVFI